MLCKDYKQSEKTRVSKLHSIFRYLIMWLVPLVGTLLRLATRAYLSRSGLPAVSRENLFLFDTAINLKSLQFSARNWNSLCHIINPLLTKIVRWRRLDLELGQYPAILTSRAVNNPHICGNNAINQSVFDEKRTVDLLARSLAVFFLVYKSTGNLACRPSLKKLRKNC